MAKTYKVWIEIEVQDESGAEVKEESDSLSASLVFASCAIFASPEAATYFAERLYERSQHLKAGFPMALDYPGDTDVRTEETPTPP